MNQTLSVGYIMLIMNSAGAAGLATTYIAAGVGAKVTLVGVEKMRARF